MSVPSTVDQPASVSLAESVAEAVRGCPGVAALDEGRLAPIATYLPGRRVEGVRIDGDRIQVSVIVTRDCPVPQLGRAIRERLADLAPGRVVDVHVADLQDPAGAADRLAVTGTNPAHGGA